MAENGGGAVLQPHNPSRTRRQDGGSESEDLLFAERGSGNFFSDNLLESRKKNKKW